MRSFFYLILLGVILATIAIVVRSGMLARKNPGEPINAAMRIALADQARPWPERDQMIIAQRWPGAAETEDGLRYVVTRPGTGEATPKRGQLATVHYAGTFIDGTKFDASADHGAPFTFVVGESKVIPGWDLAVMDMKAGEKRTLIIPYWLAYGPKGIRGKIPPQATLVFEIELLEFQ
ncbi:MAG: FKBP-type peptidyl-prolyl cis-trans isomerase [Verrucomicrobiota bacterium]